MLKIQRLKFPADLAVLICQEKFFREAQILLWLKFHYSQSVILSDQLLNEISSDLLVCQRTPKRAIRALIKRNWIGYNPMTKLIYPRSLDTIRKIEDTIARKSFIFHSTDIKNAKSFLIASAISIYLNRKEYYLRQRDRNKQRSRIKRVRHIKRIIQVPVAICHFEIARYLGISKSTASTYKTMAVNAGFLKRKRVFEEIDQEYIASKGYASYLEETKPNQYKGRVRLVGNKLLIQKSDLMTSTLSLCRRKGQNSILNKRVYRERELRKLSN